MASFLLEDAKFIDLKSGKNLIKNVHSGIGKKSLFILVLKIVINKQDRPTLKKTIMYTVPSITSLLIIFSIYSQPLSNALIQFKKTRDMLPEFFSHLSEDSTNSPEYVIKSIFN